MTPGRLRIATRSSELAIWQANAVGASLGVEYELIEVASAGDQDLESPLARIGGNGIFVKEIQNALIEGRAEIAVHSAKDLPGETPSQLVIAGYLKRGDTRDVLVGSRLEDLAWGARVATGSSRRRALLLSKRPDLSIVQLRGNIRTRLTRLSDVAGVIIAKAALDRLNVVPDLIQVLEPNEFCPQIGQGAIAIEVRKADNTLIDLITSVSDRETFLCVTAERALLNRLGAGCSLPVGARSYIEGNAVVLFGMVASSDGAQIVSGTMKSENPQDLGTRLGEFLMDSGAGELLEQYALHPLPLW